ncbi:hypothetical protein DRN86_02570 [Candidatus Geothermarchaeota archaeon]|nr:MAG: hypothetical protein DRN86_02570 [Candidatus Geothermarchaeota archaeon]
MIKQMIEKTYPQPNKALIDWKGLKSDQRGKIIGILDEIGIEYVKI